MIRDIGILQGAEPIIRHHHEYTDGSGYPEGLKGEGIPLGSRIIATVEAYEEAISEGQSQFSAGAYIRENSGKLFDPVVVDALLELISIDEG
jgi:HD-GYP domain-containing protein (c-di-GMP phosphodiesterase class II)